MEKCFFAGLAQGLDAGEGAPARAPRAETRRSRPSGEGCAVERIPSTAVRGAIDSMFRRATSRKPWRDWFVATVVLANRLREHAFMEEHAPLARDAAC